MYMKKCCPDFCYCIVSQILQMILKSIYCNTRKQMKTLIAKVRATFFHQNLCPGGQRSRPAGQLDEHPPLDVPLFSVFNVLKKTL